MEQRYITKNNTLKTRFLTLTLLTLMIGGGMKAIGQTTFELNHTSATNKTYYVTSTNEVATSANNTTANGPQAYKFYVSETPNPTTGTKYDHFYNVHVNNANATVTFIFQTTKPVGFSNGSGSNQNAFRVTKGTLKLKLDEDKYKSDITLRRVGTFTTSQNTSCPFLLINDAGAASHQRLIIEGLDPEPEQLLYTVSNVKQDTATYLPKRQFVIDGAANITSVNMTTGVPTYTGIATNKKPLFRVETGTLHLTNVTIQNSINSATDATHGGIYLMLNDNATQPDRNVDVILTHCWLHNLVSTNFKTGYPGIGLQWQMRKAHGSGSVVLKRSKFSSLSNNNGEDSAIRSTSGCTASVTIDSCNINNNFGGGIRWQGLVADPMQVKNTTIKGNYTKKSGGGIIAKSPLELTGCKILNNKAKVNGGGINYMCFDEAGQTIAAAGVIHPKNLELTMDAATIIDGNEAETGNGGGIMVWGRLINLTNNVGKIYYDYDSGIPNDPYKMLVNQNGATISNNKAYNHGGGIFIYREAGTGTDPVSGVLVRDASCYLLNCQLSYGNITGNKALNGNGGGVCINQTGTPTEVNSDHSAQDIVLTTGGLAYDMTINKNDAYLDGGGIYLYSINDGAGWNEYQKFQTTVTLKDRTKIKKNKAYTTATTTADTDHGGGGLFVQQGDVTIAGTEGAGEANNPLFEENKTQYSGAGICLIKGNIRAEYSRILSNETTTNKGRGGGVYLKEGTIRFDHSKINSNTALLHGGGIFCKGDGENPWIDFLNSEMKANYANQHGGGIYLNSGEINITGSTIGGTSIAEGNNAGSNTGGYNGGGIYTQNGNVKIDHSYIKYNIASRRGGGIYTKSGPVTITSSEICYNQAGYRKATPAATTVTTGNPAGTGGGVHTDGGLVTINPNEDEDATLKTIVNNNKAILNGGGIFTGKDGDTKGKVAVYGNHDSQGGHLIEIKDNEAVNGSGGGIFCLGDADGDRYVLLRRVNLSNNDATNGTGNQSEFGTYAGLVSGCGGGLYLYQGLIDMNLCTVDNNTAKLNGGGVNNQAGNINVQSCYIRNNEAGKNNTNNAGSGGGIYTKSGNIGINIWGTPATVQNEARRTEITGNKANLNGGGLNTHNGKIHVQGNSDDANERILINNNEATKGSGGAIFCMGEPATGGTNTTFVTLQYVDLKCNKALSGDGSYVNEDNGQTISKGCGGGVYLQFGKIKATDVVMQNNFANRNGGAINNHDGFVDIYGCVIGGDDYYDGTTLNGRGNKAGNSGGGIYTNRGNIDVEDYIEHGQGASKRFTSKLNYNWAEENGGALNTHSGTVWVNKNERDDETPITYNKAKKGGGIYANSGTIFLHNAHVDNNTATENGGGANNHAGDINIYGGSLNNNMAQEGRGGGVFTYVGDVNILPFPSTLPRPTRNDGTQVFNNLAKLNGGGINNHTGRVDARYASMRNNTSSLGNGGGIFCEGPHGSATGFTIRLLNSELKENKTRGEDGTATNPTGRGGGIYLKYGSIYAHNSQIIKNKANINGGGLDNHDGSILVYGCEISDNRAENGRGGGIYTQTGSITTGPSLVGSNSNASVIRGNYAKVNGGGINNHNGDIYLNGDHIIDNIAETGNGGGIYIANGTIDMFGGKIANNKSVGGDGGGVWSGGGEFNIQKRQGKPVVTVMDVEILSSTEAIVHYHVIDKGTSNIASHGIEIGGTQTTFDSNNPNHTTGDDGCYRIKVTDLSANNTYTAKSFATNAAPLTGESDALEFTTFSDKPSVISGTVANITKNSAEGSGKLLYSNGATTCGVVYIQKDGNLGSLSDLELTKPGVLEVHEDGTFEDEYFFTLNLPSSTQSPLSPGKKYFARAYATNGNGTAYGDTVSFVTLKNTPDMGNNLVVVDPTKITANDAHFSFTMPSSTNWNNITLYGFVISEDDDPEIHADGDHTIVFTTAPSSGYTFAKKASQDTPNPIVLKPGTTYYVRAFASNIANPGTDISNSSVTATTQFFTKDDAGKPIVRNIDISTITQHCADITGAIKDAGTSAITNYGIVWSRTNEQPEVGAQGCYNYDLTTDIPAVNENFTVHMPGTDDTLKLNTTYHVRTYAKNNAGYGYSNKFNFTTLPTNIPKVIINRVVEINKYSAKALCSVNDGGAQVTDWGLKWSSTENIADAADINQPGGTLVNNTFEVPLSGLAEGTNYYLWVYATNSVGTHTTSHYVRFKTAYDEPEVETKTISDIAYDANAAAGHQNTATFNAKVTPKGTKNVKTYGVCWSTSDNPSRMTSDYTDSGFEENTGDLSDPLEYNYANKVQKYSNTKYYVRAYASVNEPDADNKLAEIVYSPVQEFVTLPSMKTDGASTITHNSATLGGTIVSRDINGYLRGGKYGICWGTAANPTKGTDNFVEGEITATNGNTFPYTLNATGLTPNTPYYYRAYYYKGDGNIAYAKQAASTFKTKSYVLNVVSANEAQGTVNPTIVGMNQGEQVSVYANPVAGYELDSWTASSGNISGSDKNPVTFTMGTQNATLTATFKVATYDITLIASPDGGGTVSGGGTGLSYNSPVSITATANEGYTFVNWTLNGEEVSTETTYEFNVTGDATYVANFESSKGNPTSYNAPTPRPRDIYPAPASEPWDWDEEYDMVETDTVKKADTIQEERSTREALQPIDNPIIEKNTAKAGRGGGIFMTNDDTEPTKLIFAGGETEETKGKIILNYAAEAGGGIYIDKNAYMQMKGHCEVNGNWVNHGKTGGGIYLAGRLYIGEKPTDGVNKHALKVNRNFAFNKAVSDETYTEMTTLMTSDDISSNPADNERNNIFLSRNDYSFDHTANAAGDDDANVLTLLSDISGKDGDKPYTSLGFNVGHGFCPAIATSYEFGKEYNNALDESTLKDPLNYATMDTYEAWLASLMPTNKLKLDKDGSIFEDTDTYIAIHTQFITQPFRSKFIYLWGSWTNPAVSKDPEINNPMAGVGNGGDWLGHYKITNPEANTNDNDTPLEWEIYSAEGLAWFCNYVNGLNSFINGDANNHEQYKETKNSKAKAKLMADIDLEAHLWVPIGSVTKFNDDNPSAISSGSSALYTDNDDHTYKGTFDGNGHYITGIDCRYLTGIKKFGVFGELGEGAVVKNLFVDSCKYMTDKTNVDYTLGGIAGIVGKDAAVSACEARSKFDVAISKKSTTKVGGIAGFIKNGGLVHSTVGIPIIKSATAYTGGLAGHVEAGGSLYNSFANPLFPDEHYPATYTEGSETINIYIGGLVGVNEGNVENNYSRLQGDEPKKEGGESIFGWLAGTNNGDNMKYNYAPYENIVGGGVYKRAGNDPTGHGTYSATVRKDGKYGFKHRDHKIYDKDNNLVESDYTGYANGLVNKTFRGGLETALDNWVNEKNGDTKTYHPWMRSMATTINDDLPIHNYKKSETDPVLTLEGRWNAVGSKDGIYMDYRTDVNDLLKEYTALETATYPTPAIYLYEANKENDEPEITVSNTSGVANPNVMFAINEDVGIKVRGAAAEATGLKARVGTVLRNDRGGDADETTDPNWHLFSSAINEVPIGIVYHYENDPTWVDKILGKPYHPDNIWSSHAEFDPPKTTWAPGANAGYFPTNTPYGSWRGAGYNDTDNLNDDGVGGFYDFYEYNEEYYHWINYKRNSYLGNSDHWHLDHDGQPKKNHFNIPLENDETFVSGKGYLVALSSESMMMADGMLNVGDKTTTVTRSSFNTHSPNLSGYDQEWRSLALVGNPYQSYLDFGEFEKTNRETLDQPTFAVRDDDDYSYKFYTAGGSKNSAAADNLIHPHQGFFIKLKPNMATTFPDVITESITFNEGMRKAGKSLSPFRGGLDYPLVNLFCTDENGKGDYTTVEIGRPDEGGGEKMKNLHIGDGLIYARWNDTDYQTLFTPAGVSTVPVRFRPSEDGTYTITWTMENGQFNYVHLIDNIAGADVDCLTATEYKFEGNKDDYLSRFKLVFDCVGVEENEDPDPEGLKPFAFQFGEELVVNGNGYVEMFDVTGRRLMTGRANGGQSSFGIPKVAAGVYVLRLTDNGKSRVQKIVIERN